MADEKAAEKKAPAKKKEEPEYPDSPSGLALAEVGNLDGEDEADPEKAQEHGEAYQAAKRKHRWG